MYYVESSTKNNRITHQENIYAKKKKTGSQVHIYVGKGWYCSRIKFLTMVWINWNTDTTWNKEIK